MRIRDWLSQTVADTENVGASEYRAIVEVLAAVADDWEGTDEELRSLFIAILDEFAHYAVALKGTLTK